MIQVFDTHCMGYRNAKLRAFALADSTRRLDFYNFANINISDADNCGNEIETDEAGYLFYGGGQHRILCLGLQEAAIIEVSLDGGTTWQIQWIIHEPTGNGSSTEPATLSWRNANGVIETYSPNGNNKALPEYLLKRDYRAGQWAEEEVILTADDSNIQVPPWVKTLLVSLAAPGTITLTAKPRSGQVIVINACRDATFIYDDGLGDTRRLGDVARGHTYLLINFTADGGYNHGYPMLIDATDRNANVPVATERYISPSWLQSGTHAFVTQDTYQLPANGALILSFDYSTLPGTGWVTGVTNDLTIRVYAETLRRWPIIVIVQPTQTVPGAASTRLRLYFNVYDDDGTTLLASQITIGNWERASSNTFMHLMKLQYVGGRFIRQDIASSTTTDTPI